MMKSLRFVLVSLMAAAATAKQPAAAGRPDPAAATTAEQPAAAGEPVFEKDVLPLFRRYCFNCHGKSSPQLGLDLRSARSTLRGSQNGAVIVEGSLAESLLWEKVSTREMPLELFELRLSDAEIETIRRWILAGAPSDESTELPADVQEQFARFEQDVRPLLAERCVACHGAEDPEAGLDLRSLESLVRGSKSGPVIVEGSSEKSVLMRKVSSGAMPPPDVEEPLTAAEIRTMTRWIDKGRFVDYVDATPDRGQASHAIEASTISPEDRQFWAFQKPVAVAPPAVMATDGPRTPIDRFILAKLESSGLTFSGEAEKPALLRRAYFDLTGLPPTPVQARAFLQDDRPDAYERWVDRLLASPHYGERWGRHWLDAVGYVDTADKDFDPNKPALSEGYWRYRDYVIEATNKDTPWDRFLVEQIAGDELVDWRNAKRYTPETVELLTATGYLRNVMDATDEDISNLPFDRYEALFTLMDRVSTSTLGITLACARCHSHKFDPIPQTDYYRFLSLFTAAYNPSDWLQPKHRYLYSVSKPDQVDTERQRAEVAATLKQLEEQLAAIRQRYRDRILNGKLENVPEPLRAGVKTALEVPAIQRSSAQKELLGNYEKGLTISEVEIDVALNAADRSACGDLHSRIQTSKNLLATLRLEKLQALWDVGEAPTIRMLHRGDVDFAGPRVSPGFLTILSAPGRSEATPSPAAVGNTTGLRLAFAEWLTRPEHPLTARVIVNRLWQHHFGRGIVDTPGNFGATGSRPTHPALLDWLAVEFMRQGWSAKRLHRMIMTSTVYRQASARRTSAPLTVRLRSAGPQPDSIDPENRLLWRGNLRRLDAEALRDAVIAVSGHTNLAMGGPPVMLKATASGLQTIAAPEGRSSGARRSVYVLARRANPLTFLRLFDYPTIDVNCTRRSTSATPLQSLTMVNSGFLVNSAARLARRVETSVEKNAPLARKIETAYWLALARKPADQEVQTAQEYLQNLREVYERSSVEHAAALKRSFEDFVHMLLCSNEFLYID